MEERNNKKVWIKNGWDVFFKNVKVMKIKERLKFWYRVEEIKDIR